MSGPSRDGRPLVRGPQDVLAGIVVILISAVILLALGRISTKSYSTFSPALFPQVCTWCIVAGGIVLIGRGLLRDGPALKPIPFRPVVLVTAAVVIFGVVTPVMGYVVAGLLTVIVGGLATPDVRLRELGLVAVALVGLSFALFSLLLKLTLPILILPGLSL